ncbi:hypothetical protein Dshi_2560 [Dinoroseobacter shibae DFL 12 = DSM 16493]|jgi:hypothetical protein|uniref:Pvc16 N-terminal domain-containing protein n=1 Tax=Dinoroseobacter shibae (strain DSM 16493 / NCIMB 14021 / DFL 12) TaxID=398580 RepID=A8LSU4_DINSH|nr:DUF4255 domain-containing protein [Dinoroseobacter shibae]ABV94293.1 hypothetical protein Dshi_2560 [Dinoroseobacter shibae DFL 12 = DSM 16493]URF45729.1 DUF4255 domain-containing protein [Dinoroseobacter shibae]URF50034.1 DUF4255 domain-containing protein [Dinoroseobacter shibae]
MPVPTSSLAQVCMQVRDVISAGIQAQARGIEVTMGAPAVVGGIDNPTEHHLNLFFYRFEPSGFQPDTQPDLPWRMRMFCMITPFGIVEADGGQTISAGENDMRILSETMRVLHETPVLDPVTVSAAGGANGIEVRTRVVFLPATDEQINQIWSTQGETHYRPSAVYEMSLTPVMPLELASEPRMVGAIGTDIRANFSARRAAFDGVILGPPVPAVLVDTTGPGWAPATALIFEGALHRTLSFDVTAPAFAGFVPQVWIAGETNTPVDLVWQAWRDTGWETVGAAQAATPATEDIDPRNIPAGLPGVPVAAPLPEALAPDETSLQLMLTAQRQFTRYAGGPVETARSAPLLITLWREVSP